MDETTQSRTSDAAATRKRRSSILKSQRPARTPFSELEFHVATPTDTTKSRRVSFSRRTGVAEFATNEATTTWKNFYEEHNKSLESSGNDSSANASKQNLGHIGKRLFDQQFEEVDAVDFMGSLNPGYNINSSISNINFAQLTSIECTDDIKLTAPQNNFELSAFTNNHSKVFNNDITAPGMGEQSGNIDINFSTVQKIGESDDLDEIQRDFQNMGNIICHGPLRDKQNLSEYIEIDLNSTHAVLRNDESDMSITDTIHSPKVQEVSKSVSIEKIVNKDWETDKENIAVNPYITPKESTNFAINDEPDKVLVFDGKRLTIQCENIPSKPIIPTTIIPAHMEPPKATHRKTIVLNVNDDLPNFIDDSTNATGYLSVADLKKHIELDSSMSITNPIVKINETQRQKDVPYYDDNVGDISLTQAVSSNIIQEKRRTIVFEDGISNISITQAVPTNIIDKTEKRRTILYENDTGNISITQALPTHVISNEGRNAVVNENKDISMTQDLPTNITTEKVVDKIKTIVYEDDTGNLSITQAVPNIIITVKSPENPCTSEDGSGNMSVTQAIPSNIIIEENLKDRRRTVVFDSDTGNISVTQVVPANLICTRNSNDIPVDELKPTKIPLENEINRRKTIVFEDNAGNLSITEAISSNVISNLKPQENKRKTIVFDDEEADISMTQAVPMNKLLSFTKEEENKVSNKTDKRNTIVFNDEEAEMSVTQAIDQIISGFEKSISKENPKTECTEKRQTIVFGDENADISMTQVVDVNRIKDITSQTNVVADTVCDENADISMTQVVDVNLIKDITSHTNVIADTVCDENADISMTQVVDVNLIKDITSHTNVIADTVCDENADDVSVTQVVDVNRIKDTTSHTNVIADTVCDENADIPMTQVVDVNLIKDTTSHTNVVAGTVCNQNAVVSMPKDVPSTQGCIIFDDDVVLVHEELTHPVALKKSNINEILDISVGEDVKKSNQDSVMFKEFNKTANIRLPKENEIDTPVEDASLSKPIPHNLSHIQNDLQNSLKQYYTAAKNEVLDHTANVSQVLVYQMSQNAQIVQKEIEAQDSKILPNIDKLPDEEKASIDIKIDDLVENVKPIVKPVQSATKIKDNDVDEVVNDETNCAVRNVEIECSPSLDNHDNYLDCPSEEVKVTKIGSDQSIKADVRDGSNKSEIKCKDSILHDLLDMSRSSLEDKATEQNKMLSHIESKHIIVITENKECMTETPNDNLFYITKDDDEEVSEKVLPEIEQVAPLPLEYKEESPAVTELQKKLALLKSVFGKTVRRNSITEQDTCLDPKEKSMTENLEKCRKSFKNANDTNELLDMLSDLTDKDMTRIPNPQVDEEKPEPLLIKGHLALENKSEIGTEPRRISFAPERRSVILSHEDILNNISMAGAALQKSRLAVDEFDESMNETTKDSPGINISSNKSLRLSKEIVKTLKFDEDSVSEVSDSNIQISPLKKTAFGETAYMTDAKIKVIPSYMKNVTEGLKELMHDLVKPMVDNRPFDSVGAVDRTHKKTGSTCSMQVQANLITSSQIDINGELYSNSGSINVFPKTSSAEIIEDAVRRSMARSVKSSTKSVTIITPESDNSMEVDNIPDNNSPPSSQIVIVFDHKNPLNNILLPPLEHGDIHKYNPINEIDSPSISLQQMNVENYMKTESAASNVSKPVSVDRSENTQNDFKDTEVNTIIAMKGNKELLEASSSLTLVDDTGLHKPYDLENRYSPVQLLYKLDEDEIPEKDSDFTSNEDLVRCETKAKKRIYSPAKVDKHKYCTLSSLDITPRPLSKMQKISEQSFKQEKIEKPTKLKADKDENRTPIKRMPSPTQRISFSAKRQTSPSKRSPTLTKHHKKKDNMIVQQVMTDIKMNIDHEVLGKQIKEALNKDRSSTETKSVSVSNSDMHIDMVSSFTSSKNLGRDDRSIVTSSGEYHLSGQGSRMEWLSNQDLTKNCPSECDSSVNIVAKIDMLPFMGSHECEWESSIGDTWSFRLLHSCLRLTVRLQHRHENAARTCVRADTPVLHSMIETIHTEKKNPIAVLCVRFACEAMRFELSQGCSRAGSVPGLVRRCSATARLATRWARAMHDIRARLAYTLTQDGILALKVANIPLRSVWEIHLKLDLVVSEAGSAPFPRATPLTVVRVLAERHVHVKELRHLVKDVAHDWGHAPRTIWRIFKYLKNKRREDEFLEINY